MVVVVVTGVRSGEEGDGEGGMRGRRKIQGWGDRMRIGRGIGLRREGC